MKETDVLLVGFGFSAIPLLRELVADLGVAWTDLWAGREVRG